MGDSLLDQANRAAIDAIKAAKPQAFTVGGYYDGTSIVGGVTVNRTWKNGWGATAYARAWWDDLAVTPSAKPKVEVGAEFVKKF